MSGNGFVERELLRFDASVEVESAWTPPASWYVAPEFLDAERKAVFRPSWQVVGRTDQVRRAGDFFSGELLGEPWVVVRGEDGRLRAFANVCRHHAAIVAVGEGCAERLRCPYHGWTYDLEGRLTSAPRVAGVRDFDRASFRLPSYELATLGPLILLRLASEGGWDASELDPVERRLEARGHESLEFVARRRYEMRCNWKVYVDNYLDGGYHVPVLHAGLAGQLELSEYRTELLPHASIQSCPAAHSAAGAHGDFAERLGDGALYAWIHPNAMINRYGPWMDVNVVLPLAHDRTEVVFDFWLSRDVTSARGDFVEKSLAASDSVQEEDRIICESVQRGLSSGSYECGRYAPTVEHAMHHFHRMLALDLERHDPTDRHALVAPEP